MEDKKVFLVIGLAVVLLTASLLHAAYTYGEWRQFLVSEFAILVTAVALTKLLRTPDRN